MNGEKNPEIKFDKEPKNANKQVPLTRKDIMFQVDEDGKAIPEKIDVDVYDRVLDDELMLTTVELDNALTMHESTKDALILTVKSLKEKIDKLYNKKKVIKDEKKLSEIEQEIKDHEKTLGDLEFQTNVKLNAYLKRISECRQDLKSITKMIEDSKEIRTIEAIPCTVSESNRYFNKHQYKNDKGEWTNPKDEDDKTWITKLLTEKVISPKLSESDWELTKPQFRMSIKETISEISGYSKISPREYLIESRRSEKLKNIEGETQ